MDYLFLFLDCFVLQDVPKLQAGKMGSSMWCTIVRFQSRNLSFVKVCVYVLCLPKKHLRERRRSQCERHAKQFSHTRLKVNETPHGIFRSMRLPLFPLITVWWLINSFPAGASLAILIVMITCLF